MADGAFPTTHVYAGSIVWAASIIDAGFVGVAAILVLAVAEAAIGDTAGLIAGTTAVVLRADIAVLATVLADKTVAEVLNVAAFLDDVARAELPFRTAFAAAIEIRVFLRAGAGFAHFATAALLAFLMGIGDALAVVAHLAAFAIVVFLAAGSLFVAAAVATNFIRIAQRLTGK